MSCSVRWFSATSLVAVLLATTLAACGTVTPMQLAEALLDSSPSQQARLFAEDGVYVDPNGARYVGRDQILGRLQYGRQTFVSAVVVEPPHAEEDHIAWTRITTSGGPDPPEGMSFRLHQSMWAANGKITRIVASALASN